MEKSKIFDMVDELKSLLYETSDYLWAHPEIGGEEKNSSNLYRNIFKDEGFNIVESKLETAFYAEYGKGFPVICILGEYDALPALSQAVATEKKPVDAGAPGHGCGHNLLGAASMTASIALKRYLEKEKKEGTIRFYGCPEEELLCGKIKMIAEGMFKGCDIALSWHPTDANMVHDAAYLANTGIRFFYKGLSSHAGFAPERGRSALDAVELMNVGTNYLREHVVDRTRIHYTTDSGGFAPNIVPDKASSWFFVRAPHVADVKDTVRRLKLVAEGAALMTETTVKFEQDFGTSEFLENTAFASLSYENLQQAPLPQYAAEEMEFAKKLQAPLSPEIVQKMSALLKTTEPMHQAIGDRDLWKKNGMNASSDSGDISQIMPTALFTTACLPVGVAPHTWQATSSVGSTLGKKGALYAAQTMAGIAYDLLNDHKKIAEIKAEFDERKNSDYAPILKDGFSV